ncbi:MinD/ParA family ATP-binding protein [Clostridium felsineum]|uniref:Uncharacterized protein n=1 Tax=Clostridium felsineum TaxID=36839 RepID=A0A1S8LFV0_9CLOT|nr:hypothetical protein [Clostridium felsineum]URZ06729.1 hypothetical protein CLROS_020620 [Clostridium felsineum]URZ11762.1 hypothetical protein CROST_024790 [Clostridium felsineum]
MDVALATGMTELDNKVTEILKERKDIEVTKVNYREFFKIKHFNIVVISNRLVGDIVMSKLLFDLKSNNTRVVYLTSSDDPFGIKECFNYSINDILLDPVKPSEIINLILKPNSFSDISDIYLEYSGLENKEGKITNRVIEKKVEVPVKEIVYKTRTMKKSIITVYTTDDAFVTADFITQLSVILSKKVDQKILILDFNTLFPVMDNFLGVKKEINIESKYDIEKSTSLTLMYNALERDILNENNLVKFVKKHPKYKNIDLATGLYDLMLFEKMPNEYFSKIVNTASRIYDTILINTNPDISLGSTFVPIKLSSEIIFIVKPNYTSIRNALFVAENFKNVITKDKLNFVIYDFSPKSLDSEIIEELFCDYKLIGYIPKDDIREYALNKQKPFIETIGVKKESKKAYYSILEKLDYVPKASFFSRFFVKKEGAI